MFSLAPHVVLAVASLAHQSSALSASWTFPSSLPAKSVSPAMATFFQNLGSPAVSSSDGGFLRSPLAAELLDIDVEGRQYLADGRLYEGDNKQFGTYGRHFQKAPGNSMNIRDTQPMIRNPFVGFSPLAAPQSSLGMQQISNSVQSDPRNPVGKGNILNSFQAFPPNNIQSLLSSNVPATTLNSFQAIPQPFASNGMTGSSLMQNMMALGTFEILDLM